MISALTKFSLRENEPNFLIGVAGNGLSTTLQTEIYSSPQQATVYLSFINLIDNREQAVLLEIANAILLHHNLPKLNIKDFPEQQNFIEIFKATVAKFASSTEKNAEPLTLIFDEFQQLKSYSNAFFFVFDKLISLPDVVKSVRLTSILIADEYLTPRASGISAGVGKLFFHHLNIDVIPGYTLEQMRSGFLSSELESLTETAVAKIYSASGGIPALFVSITDLLKQNPAAEINLQNFDLEWKVNDLWDSLGAENQEFLKGIVKHGKLNFANSLQEKFLLATGILSESGKIKPQLLVEFISKLLEIESQLDSRLRLFITGNVEIDLSEISPQMGDILKLITEQKGKLVTREQIAKQLWGEHYLDRYSDYAIDKLISQIRQYIRTEQLPVAIKTYKSKGYFLQYL